MIPYKEILTSELIYVDEQTSKSLLIYSYIIHSLTHSPSSGVQQAFESIFSKLNPKHSQLSTNEAALTIPLG